MKAARIKIPVERIEKVIYLIRGEKVMLDNDLAEFLNGSFFKVNPALRRLAPLHRRF